MLGVTERSAMAAMTMEPPTPRAAELEQLSADSMRLQAALAGSSSRFDELPREGFSAVSRRPWILVVR